jgi:hypothetical protein
MKINRMNIDRIIEYIHQKIVYICILSTIIPAGLFLAVTCYINICDCYQPSDISPFSDIYPTTSHCHVFCNILYYLIILCSLFIITIIIILLISIFIVLIHVIYKYNDRDTVSQL